MDGKKDIISEVKNRYCTCAGHKHLKIAKKFSEK